MAQNSKITAGYKQTDVGVIPEDWEVENLGELISDMTDYVASGSFESLRNNVSVFDSHNYALYVRLFDLRLGLGHQKQKYIDKKSYKFLSRSNLYGNEILVANIGANVGEAFVMPKTNQPASIAPNMIVVRTNINLLKYDYLFQYMKSDFGQKWLEELIAGSGHPKLNKTDFKQYKILKPSLSEQEKIAETLSDIDSLITKLDQLIQKKKNIKQGAMQELLTGKRRLPGFSGEWEETTLKEITEMSSGGTPSTRIKSYYDGNIMWASIADMTNSMKYISITEKKLTQSGISNSSAKLFPKGTVLYAMYASIGECCIAAAPMATSQAILGIKCLSTIMNEYLYYYLTSMKDYIKTLGQQGTQSNLNKVMVQKFELKLPSIEEQKAIVRMLSNVDDEIEILKKKKHKYQVIKQGMMQQLLTGKIRLI